MSTPSGDVTLDFGEDVVTVHDVPIARQRAARLTGGALLGVFGLAAVAGNASDRGRGQMATVVWLIAGLLVLAGVIGATLWLVLAARGRRAAGTSIAASTVMSAQSRVDGNRIVVSLRTADGMEEEFSARGHAGAVLATEFGRLLSATDTPQPHG